MTIFLVLSGMILTVVALVSLPDDHPFSLYCVVTSALLLIVWIAVVNICRMIEETYKDIQELKKKQ